MQIIVSILILYTLVIMITSKIWHTALSAVQNYYCHTYIIFMDRYVRTWIVVKIFLATYSYIQVAKNLCSLELYFLFYPCSSLLVAGKMTLAREKRVTTVSHEASHA